MKSSRRKSANPRNGKRPTRLPAAAAPMGGGPGRARTAQPQRPAFNLPLMACILVAVLARSWALTQQPWITADGTEYVRFAESLRSAKLYVSVFPPGYPALIALARFVIDDRVLSAAAVSLVCGALLPLPVWVLARTLVGERWALLPAAIVALHPVLLLYSGVVMSESAYLLALYGAMAMAATPWLCGLALGAAFSIRPEALVVAVPLAMTALVLTFLRRPSALRQLVGIAAFLAFAMPCWLYFRAEFHQWVLTPKVEAFRHEAASWRQEEARAVAAPVAPQRFDVGARLASYGSEALRRYPHRAVMHGRSLLQFWPWPLLLLSVFGLARKRSTAAMPLLHLLAIPALALSGQPRFVISLIPALAVFAAVPFTLTNRRAVRLVLAGLALAGIAWCVTLNGKDLVLPYDAHFGAEKDAGNWLAASSSPNDAVMDRKPYVAFYAQRPYVHMPDESYDGILDYARSSGARYLVISHGVARVFRPQLLPLLEDDSFRDRETRVEIVYIGGIFRGYAVGVFRVLRHGEQKTGEPPRVNLNWFSVAPGAGAGARDAAEPGNSGVK